MPVQVSYPGVYVEEVDSGVRTIVGVATSITAFVGRAKRGPTDEPGTVYSWGDFERLYGGLDVNYPMSYAVRDFFLNGSGEALIVRLFRQVGQASGVATIDSDTLHLQAADPGSWGNKLTLMIDHDGIDSAEIGQDAHRALHERFGLDPDVENLLFNLTVTDGDSDRSERIANVTFVESARRVDRVLEQTSSLVRLGTTESGGPNLPTTTTRPAKTAAPQPFVSGEDSALLDNAQDIVGDQAQKTGLYMLEKADLFNLLCIPADTAAATPHVQSIKRPYPTVSKDGPCLSSIRR